MTDTPAALDFLERWEPGGPWVLTAILPDRTSIKTATFTDRKEAGAWLGEVNGTFNCYFHVNPCTGPLTKKANLEEVAALAWLHVDIDPREGEDIEEERARALKLLQDYVPAPTVIIFSGGGYQGFWRLEDPLPIDGDLEKAEHAKLYNLTLETALGADACHNVDRIMRLPGTVNLPDKNKLKKGRTKVLAELVEFNDNVYPLSTFTPSAPLQTTPDPTKATGPTVAVDTDNVQRLDDVHDLDKWDVPDRVKVIIVQGRIPNEPKEGDDSRSAWLFDCVCNLVRADVPDNVIYSVITDPDFGISESVLASSSTEKYALKQIESAKAFAVDPLLAEFNEKYAVVKNVGGKCRVVFEVKDAILDRYTLAMQTFGDFRNAYCNKLVQVGSEEKPKYIPEGQWWLTHRKRREYERVVFSPEHEVPNAYNLWTGFSCSPVPGECGPFLDHIRTVLCGDVQEYYDYLLGWMARLVQRPGSPGQSAVVLRGDRGTGKGFFVHHLGSLFGRHYLQISDPKHLVGNFNVHLRDCLLLFGDEAFYAGDKKHESVLKMLVTEDLLTVEAKGVDVESAANLTHIILASNGQWVVPAGASERRFFVLDVDTAHRQDTHYFGTLAKQMKSGGREALLHTLLTHDNSNFNVRNVPKTAALEVQKQLSMPPDEEWWFHKLREGCILPDSNGEPWPETVLKAELEIDYTEYMREFNVARRGNRTTFRQFLVRVCPGLQQYQARRGSARPYVLEFPSLEACRTAWVERAGPVEWPVSDIRDETAGDPDPF